ncbi:SDR family oxidoreductase [Corallincola platygyrae]
MLTTRAKDAGEIPHEIPEGTEVIRLDLEDESTIESAFAYINDTWPQIDQLFVTSGMLHNALLKPEKSLSQLTSAHLAHSWQINAVGPLLVAKHAETMLKRSQQLSVFAVLSARVSSISDNRLGGWYGYRMSKAALNMGIKNLSIEWQRKRLNTVCVGLHPGTTDSPLSEPFQANVPEGQLFSPDKAASHLIKVISKLTIRDSGKLFAWDGQMIPW